MAGILFTPTKTDTHLFFFLNHIYLLELSFPLLFAFNKDQIQINISPLGEK